MLRPGGPQANSEFGIRSSEFIEKRTVQTVGAPSASLRPCGRPRGTVLVCRVLWRMRGERIFFLFACPKRKNQRETTLGRGRLRFLPLPRPTLFETPKRGAPLLAPPGSYGFARGFCISQVPPPERLPPPQGEVSRSDGGGLPAGRGQAPPLHGDGRFPALRAARPRNFQKKQKSSCNSSQAVLIY